MTITYSILEKERRDLTVWCMVECFADGDTFTIHVPTYNPQNDQEVHDAILNAATSYKNNLLNFERIDNEILPLLG